MQTVQTAADTAAQVHAEAGAPVPVELGLAQFIDDFGDSLLDAVREQCAPVYDGMADTTREKRMDALLRSPFPAQRDVVQSVLRLLVDRGQPAAIINAEMGTGKTMMAIAAAALMHYEGFQRTLVIAPPHLVYKWRREIRETVPGARVWILNGPDTLRKLLVLRSMRAAPSVPEFFVLGRVRMRMGYHWRAAFASRTVVWTDELGARHASRYASCCDCGAYVTRKGEEGDDLPLSLERAGLDLAEERCCCTDCGAPLWTLTRKGRPMRSRRELVIDALRQMPTIGPKTAENLVTTFGEELLSGMLEDNLYDFVNLMDEEGELVFSDRQARRIERALANTEIAFGQGDYQATEFVKRYLPQGYFGLLVVDEGHEYKNEGSAQGQAMGVLARKCRKTLLLTGTLMGGYADDLFHLLWRLNPAAMIEDGYTVNARGRLGAAQLAFMREHGVLKDIFREGASEAHKTAKGSKRSHRTSKGPGFGPKGIMRYVLPITAFLKLKDIGGDVLPPYEEVFEQIALSEEMREAYSRLAATLTTELKQALVRGDNSLLGVVLNVLLAWPDCAFRDELVKHPRTRAQLVFQRAVLDDAPSPKEAALIQWCAQEKANGRRVLVYTTYSGKRDTAARLRVLLEARGFKVAVLRASVDAAKREDWVADQVDRGIDALICNPELVKTGLDLLEFPTIVFMQSGYNVFTLQQAARRSWRIGQQQAVKVVFLGYAETAQMQCLELMAKKIAVAQSTSGDMPDSGLDVLNQSGDSIEVALARQLVA
jgi:superfamily II DNA or RNA helicase